MQLAPLEKPPDTRHGVLDFLFLVRQGIVAWQEAGELLAKLRSDNPNIYQEIIDREPSLTKDMLETMERIGRKEVYPPAILDSSMASKRLLSYDYAEQVRLTNESIEIVVAIQDGLPVVAKRMVNKMTRAEMKLALGPTGARTIAEQVVIFENRVRTNPVRPKDKTCPLADKSCPGEGSLPETAPPQPRPVKRLGLFAVRVNRYGTVIFEPTKAQPANTQRVIIEGEVGVIEVCRY